MRGRRDLEQPGDDSECNRRRRRWNPGNLRTDGREYNDLLRAGTPGIVEFADRMALVMEDNPWLVMEQQGVIVGYAYATVFRSRAAYSHTRESSSTSIRTTAGKASAGS